MIAKLIPLLLLTTALMLLVGCGENSEPPDIDITVEARVEESLNDNPDQYEREIQNYAAADYNRGIAHGYLGMVYGYLVQHERAIGDFDEAIRLNPQDAEAYYNRGLTYSYLDQYERIIEDYDQAIRLNPQDAEAYNNRGLLYRYLGQYERAIGDFDEAIRLDSKYAEAYYNRGITYSLIGKSIKAERDFAKAKELGIEAPSPYRP